MSENSPARVGADDAQSGVPEIVSSIEAPATFSEHVEAWRYVENQVEERLWQMAQIASSLCGNYDADQVKQFARQVNYSPGRIYEVAAGWQLRSSMPSQRERVGEWKRNRPLTLTHFIHAGHFDDPQGTIERCLREGISASQLYDERRVMIRARSGSRSGVSGRKAPLQIVGDEEQGVDETISASKTPGHLVSKTHFSGVCDECGAELRDLPKLPGVLREFDMTHSDMAYAAGVDEELIAHLCNGHQIAQSLCYRIMEVVQEKLAAKSRERERLGLR